MKLETTFLILLSALLFTSSLARAQDALQDEYQDEYEEAYEDESAEAEVIRYEEPAPAQYHLEEPSSLRVDGPRFRAGGAFTFGGEWVGDADFSAWLVGFEGRLGVQINDLVAIYAMPHLSFGRGTQFGRTGSTGTFAITAGADFTFLNSLFVGAGFGYGAMNNPSGPIIAFRVGGYPLKAISDDRPRRKGLMVALEMRTFFLGDPEGTGVQLMGSLGYEAF